MTAIVPDWRAEMVGLKEAEVEFGFTRKTLILYCRLYGVGHRPAGRWLLDRRRLIAWRNGESFPPLECQGVR